MSTTASITIQPPEASSHREPVSSCPNCGAEVPKAQPQAVNQRETQARIDELESQVKILTLRATSAVERANEYEASLRRLTHSARSPAAPVQNARPGTANSESPIPHMTGAREHSSGPEMASTLPSSHAQSQPSPLVPTSRIARLLTRSDSTNSAPGPSTAPLNRPSHLSLLRTPGQEPAYPATAGFHSTEVSLLDALTHEQNLRKAAESAVAQTNSEIEELTGQLFEQANEMVATERKARARLEERVEMLEKRDSEKTRRLTVLEKRILRVERVRALLGEGTGSGDKKEDSAEPVKQQNSVISSVSTG